MIFHKITNRSLEVIHISSRFTTPSSKSFLSAEPIYKDQVIKLKKRKRKKGCQIASISWKFLIHQRKMNSHSTSINFDARKHELWHISYVLLYCIIIRRLLYQSWSRYLCLIEVDWSTINMPVSNLKYLLV